MTERESSTTYLAARLKETAEAHGSTVYAWAFEARVNPSNLYRAMGGHRNVSRSELEKLAAVESMGVSIEQLQAWADWSILGEERARAIRKYVLEDERKQEHAAPPPPASKTKLSEMADAAVAETSTRRQTALAALQASQSKPKRTPRQSTPPPGVPDFSKMKIPHVGEVAAGEGVENAPWGDQDDPA